MSDYRCNKSFYTAGGKKYKVVNINSEVYNPKEDEVFKDVVGFEGRYAISNYGTVKSLNRVSSRKGGTTRKVSEKVLAHSFNLLCLSGKGYNKTVSVPTTLMAAFYPEFNSDIHYVKKVSNDNPIPLNNYQYFQRLDHNPVTVTDLSGVSVRYNNYKEFKGNCKILDVFLRGSSIKIKHVNISCIAFDHPVLYKDEVKIVAYIADSRCGSTSSELIIGDKLLQPKQYFKDIIAKDGAIHLNIKGEICKTKNAQKARALVSQGFEMVKIKSI